MKRLIIILLAVFAMLIRAMAQITVSAPDVVAVDEKFNVTFTLTEKPSDFDWSPGDNFRLLWGPQTGSSTSVSIINGTTKRSSQYTFTYIVMPVASGSFSLPSATAVVDGNTISSRSARIEVVGQGSRGESTEEEQEAETPASAPRPASGSEQDLFMRFSLSRTSAVVGEPIIATLKLYTRGSIAGFEDAKFPSFEGFWAQEIEAPQNIEFRRENVGDRIYNSALLRKWVIIPQKSGTLSLEPAELVCLVQERVSTGNSIFDVFYDDYQTFRKRVRSSAYDVRVSPVPSGAPASYDGAVGSFKIEAKLDRDSVSVHDAMSLTIKVSGNGNVALVRAPKVNFPPDSEVYDTKTSDNLSKGSAGMSGVKTFEYPFIPRSAGDFTIDPIEFSYFDVNSRRYVTVHTAPLSYHVEKGNATDYVPSEGISVPARGDVRNLSEDIHYISTRLPDFSDKTYFFAGSPLFIVLALAIVFVALLVALMTARMRKNREDVVMVRTKGASKAARRRLSISHGYLVKDMYSEFYEELHKALLGYASDKLNISVADLSKESIAAAFTAAGAGEDLTSAYTILLDTCESARYSPDRHDGAMKESYDMAVNVISSLDGRMNRSNKHKVAAALALLLMMGQGVNMAARDASADSLWNNAVAAYAGGDYSQAFDAFRSIEQMGLTSTELYVNMGDASFRLSDIPSAILYYNRALKIDPSDRDATYNLNIARQRVHDKIDVVPEFFLKSWSRKVCYLTSSNVWAALFLIFLALGCAMTVLFFLSRASSVRKTGFFSAIVCFLLCIPCIVNANWQKKDFENRDSAVVFSSVARVKNAPSGSGDLFLLHEGTEVRVLETVGEWSNIVLADGREGWIHNDNITII